VVVDGAWGEAQTRDVYRPYWQRWRMHFRGDKVVLVATVKQAPGIFHQGEATYRLDAGKRPGHLDLIFGEVSGPPAVGPQPGGKKPSEGLGAKDAPVARLAGTLRAIYELRDDTLRIAFDHGAWNTRPRDFSPPEGPSQRVVLLLKREPPGGRPEPQADPQPPADPKPAQDLPLVPMKPPENPALQNSLAKLEAMRNGGQNGLKDAVELGKELLRLYPRRDDQALIYYTLAHVFAQSEVRLYPDQVTKYARLALASERYPARRATLHIYLGCAAEVPRDEQAFPEKRRRAARAYLEGYKELLALRLPEQAPPLPDLVTDRNADGLDRKEVPRVLPATDVYREARRQAEVLRELVAHRYILVGQVAQLYRREPADDAELRRLAAEVLQPQRAVDEFLGRVARWKHAWEK
jgi:uncharacterized protein (TIGR03067 family)